MEIHSQASTILQIRTSHTLYAYTFVRVCGIEKVYLSNIHVLCVYFVSKASHFGWTGCFYCVIKYLPHKFKIKVIMYVTHTHTPYAETFKHVRSQSTKFSLCSFGSFFFVGNLNAFGAERSVLETWFHAVLLIIIIIIKKLYTVTAIQAAACALHPSFLRSGSFQRKIKVYHHVFKLCLQCIDWLLYQPKLAYWRICSGRSVQKTTFVSYKQFVVYTSSERRTHSIFYRFIKFVILDLTIEIVCRRHH